MTSTHSRLAVVAGVLAGKAFNGGHVWTRISLIAGLQRLGFEVMLVEEVNAASTPDKQYFDRVCAQFSIDGYLVNENLSQEVVSRAETADLLLNIGGHLTNTTLKRGPRIKVYLDDDPGYTQLWIQAGLLKGRLEGHDFHFTFGQNVGRADCPLPVDGIGWRPMLPPVVLDQWPRVPPETHGFTTVARWRGGYGRVEANGRRYGQKAHEFRRFVDMPHLTSRRFEIALAIDPIDEVDRQLMHEHGWCLVDPHLVAAFPDDFRTYVQHAWAEFSVAQGVYVETRCGWFSDRTTRFLASGKPALVQDTGFSTNLPTGEGLVAFSTVDEAVAGALAIERDYEAHARRAREIAETYFDSDKVLGGMLDEVGV